MASLAPFLTVYNRTGLINPDTAPDEVLGAIPDITAADFKTVRTASSSKDRANPALAGLANRLGPYLSEVAGPAYMVMVAVRRPTLRQTVRKTFVIITGLDNEAPYRLLAEQPAH